MPKSVAAQGKVDLSKYDKLDGEWKKIGLSAPARRALINAKLTKIEHLKKLTEKQLMSLHGMGPSSLPIIKKAMKKYKINFRL
jgi:DNA-directed RNA polymerase alpha subunit